MILPQTSIGKVAALHAAAFFFGLGAAATMILLGLATGRGAKRSFNSRNSASSFHTDAGNDDMSLTCLCENHHYIKASKK
jgi:cytochrome c biogenesis protein CcdA